MITLKGAKELEKLLKSVPKKAERAAVVALTKTGQAIKKEMQREMKALFDKPVKYTLNSLQLDPATKARPEARVGFKSPDRMQQHYLVPQVEGGPRKLKGFERGVGLGELTPAMGARMTQAGNVSPGQIRQIMSVLGKAETSAGYSANLTARSGRRNLSPRDYVVLHHPHGRLFPGIYQRFQTGTGFGARTKRSIGRFGTYQRGTRKVAVRDPRTGRIIRWVSPASRIQSIVRARGLRPVMLQGKQNKPVTPLLPFYDIARDEFNKTFPKIFQETFEKFLKS